MVKLKNYNVVLKHFVLLLTFTFLISCAEKKYTVSKIEGKEIGITPTTSEVAEIENFIKPYREKIDKDLNVVLCTAPETIDKTGEWQTPMGNFLADITYEKATQIFQLREQKSVDLCILNHGGIRTVIAKGALTARNAYEIMPFENSAVVIALKGEQVLEIVKYIISEKKPHPLKGMTFTIDKDNQPKSISIGNQPLDLSRTYYVATSDYLSYGNDNMVFFKKGIARYDLDYKLRNIIIDYFKEHKVITASKEIRIIKE
jgi:2',3'-cyclic-nucleotide 2'-phosphodiesterase (5'-nucleotidase family)